MLPWSLVRRPCAPPARSGAVAVLVALAGLSSSALARETRALVSIRAATLERAREGAARRLERSDCQQLFHEFRDSRGRTLVENLAKFDKTPADYLRMLVFLDGASHPLCRRGRAYLFAGVGIARVFVCPEFASKQIGDPLVAESMVIHEVLHTLGLGENPPSSQEITRRVNARCQ